MSKFAWGRVGRPEGARRLPRGSEDNASREGGRNAPWTYDHDQAGTVAETEVGDDDAHAAGDLLDEPAAHAVEEPNHSWGVSCVTPVMTHGDPRVSRGVLDVYRRISQVVEGTRGRGQGHGRRERPYSNCVVSQVGSPL